MPAHRISWRFNDSSLATWAALVRVSYNPESFVKCRFSTAYFVRGIFDISGDIRGARPRTAERIPMPAQSPDFRQDGLLCQPQAGTRTRYFRRSPLMSKASRVRCSRASRCHDRDHQAISGGTGLERLGHRDQRHVFLLEYSRVASSGQASQ